MLFGIDCSDKVNIGINSSSLPTVKRLFNIKEWLNVNTSGRIENFIIGAVPRFAEKIELTLRSDVRTS